MSERSPEREVARARLLRPGMDRRRAFFVLLPKLWLVLAGLLLGAVLGAAGYLIYNALTDPGPCYMREMKLYIDFAFNEKTKENYDYYNAYTWNDILHTEELLGRVYEALSKEGQGPSKEELWEMVSLELPSDIRLIHLRVESPSAELTDLVCERTAEELMAFAERMEEFRGIRILETGETGPIVPILQTGRAAALGAVLGALFALVLLGLWYSLDDRLLVPGDLMRLTGLPVAFSLKGEEAECGEGVLPIPAGTSVSSAQLLVEEKQPERLLLTGVEPRLLARCERKKTDE